MLPHEATEGGTPNPRKLRLASMTIVEANPKLATTVSGPSVLGRMCRSMIQPLDAPSARAAWTYSSSRSDSVMARSTRAYWTQPTMPITAMSFSSPGPTTAITATYRMIVGNASWISETRMMPASTQPPKNPDSSPRLTPIAPDMATAQKPTSNEMRAPKITRLSTSWPRASVPKKWLADKGGRSRSTSETAAGSWGASHGANTAATTASASTNSPTAARRMRRRSHITPVRGGATLGIGVAANGRGGGTTGGGPAAAPPM